MRAPLRREAWPEAEAVLLDGSFGEVSAFRYRSGVEALRVRTERVEAVVLPYQGQQVWRLALDHEPVTMRTMWDEPVPTQVFAASYGPFLMHCGLTGMGQAGPGDTHPTHGELPCAAYGEAWLEVDEAAGTVTVAGAYDHRLSHAVGYRFTPRLTFTDSSSSLGVAAIIENLRHSPLSWMYLAHLNWAYWPQARLEQDVPMDAEHVVLWPADSQDAETASYTAALADDPARGNVLPDHGVVPEYVAVLTPTPQDDGWARFAMTRDDGVRAEVGYDTTHLPRAVRWVSNTPDEQAAGFCMPATGHHKGRTRSEADGLVRTLAAGDSVTLRLTVSLTR